MILRRALYKAAAQSCIPVRCVDSHIKNLAHNIAVMQISGACIAAVLLLFVSISAARELQQSSSASASEYDKLLLTHETIKGIAAHEEAAM